MPEKVSTYVRNELSSAVSSIRVAPRVGAYRTLNRERSPVAPLASGVWISSHTQRLEDVEGTNRSEGVKSIAVPPPFRRTSACTLIVDCNAWHGASHVPGP